MERPATVGWMRQFRYFAWLYERISMVSGDIVECGLGEGNTFVMLAYLCGSGTGRVGRSIWGFDSFEGWPEPVEHDASPRNPKKGEWRVSEEEVRRRLDEAKIDASFSRLDIRLVKGFFDITLPCFPQDREIAFLHLDCDLYPGYRDALRHLFPRVAVGGIVAFDEYREYPPYPPYNGVVEKWPGCTKAVDDYFELRPEKPRFHAETGKYYLVKGRK